MGKPKTDLAPRIRGKTTELLLEKKPEEISTKDIAKVCGIISFISEQVKKGVQKQHKSYKSTRIFGSMFPGQLYSYIFKKRYN